MSLAEARRLALAAQGFARPRPATVDESHFDQVLGDIALLQMDSVNVVERAHYFPLFSRLGPYDRSLFDDYAYGKRRMFEAWAHEASLLPMEMYPLHRHRMENGKIYPGIVAFAREQAGYVDAILGEIRERGPVVVGELEDPGARTGPWWGYGKGKLALEWHFRKGTLAIRERRNFARVYDLPERVIPAEVLAARPVPAEAAFRELLLRSARAHGVGIARDIADYFRLSISGAKPVLAAMAVDGQLEAVRVEGWREPAYMLPGRAPPPVVEARALVCPFDPVVWERARSERLFNFRYRIEIYTPAEKRIYGYYVLPFVLGDEIVARVDVKADRAKATLLVRATHLEPGHDAEWVAQGLARELDELARWLGLSRVRVGPKGNLARALRAARR